MEFNNHQIEIQCEDVTDLWNKLKELDDDTWFFRGHFDESYRLIPSLWRNTKKDGEGAKDIEVLYNNFCNSITKNDHSCIDKLVDQIHNHASQMIQGITKERMVEFLLRLRFEYYLLSQFYTVSNKIGLKVPNQFIDHHHLYDPLTWANFDTDRGITFSKRRGGVNQEHFLSQYFERSLSGASTLDVNLDATLPQHYGLPTRLLDWTTNYKKAAFFAAGLKNDRNVKIAIYAIKKNKPSNLQILNQHLRYENSFLHAQEGIFTDIGGYAEKYFLEYGQFPSLEDMHKQLPEDFTLKKFILSINFIPELLHKLKKNGICHATMMPHYTFVVEQVKSELKYQNLYS